MSEHPWNRANITFISLSSLYNSFKTYMDFLDFQYSLKIFFLTGYFNWSNKAPLLQIEWKKKFKLSFCQILRWSIILIPFFYPINNMMSNKQ